MLKPQEIKALISLIDDPDAEVYHQVKSKITSLGSAVIADLEKAWEDFSNGPIFQKRVEQIIHEIQFNELCIELSNWCNSIDNRLLDGLFLISKYQYPDLDQERYLNALHEIEKEIWIELNDQMTVFEKLKVFNKIFYDINGFRGNTTNFHSPQNSFINDVLDSKKANPVLLACLYMILAGRLGIQIRGVNLPRHFVLLITQPNISQKFFINAFNKGTLLSKRDIEYFLRQVKVESNESYFTACSNKAIIKRILHNLLYAYQNLGYKQKVEQINILLETLKQSIE